MKVSDIDYYSIYGNSILHRISAYNKALAVTGIILFSVISDNYVAMLISTVILYGLLLSLEFSKPKLLLMTLYPLVFLIFYFLSIDNISTNFMIITILKVLNCSTSSVLLALTTPYVELIKSANIIFPSFIVNFMFLTYRSFFLLWDLLSDLKTAIYIRGEINIFRPIYLLQTLSHLVGFLIIRAIEKSEVMYDCMKVRGYSDKLSYLQD